MQVSWFPNSQILTGIEHGPLCHHFPLLWPITSWITDVAYLWIMIFHSLAGKRCQRNSRMFFMGARRWWRCTCNVSKGSVQCLTQGPCWELLEFLNIRAKWASSGDSSGSDNLTVPKCLLECSTHWLNMKKPDIHIPSLPCWRFVKRVMNITGFKTSSVSDIPQEHFDKDAQEVF